MQSYTLAGREMGEIEPVDVKLLAHQILRQVPGGPSFIMSFDGPEGRLHTSRSSLTTVLHVLLHNGVVHHDMPPGRIFIEEREAGSFMSFVIADDGPGIPAQHRESVFGLFITVDALESGARATDTHDRDEQHCGAGLAIAKRVVETLGGEINLLPREGRGTRIHFTWPREQTAEARTADALARLSLKTLSAKKDPPRLPSLTPRCGPVSA